MSRLNRRKSLKDRAAVHMVGTDFVFGTEVREGDRARTTTLPVAIEFNMITHSDGKSLWMLPCDDLADRLPSGHSASVTDSNQESASQAKLGDGNQARGLKEDVMNIC